MIFTTPTPLSPPLLSLFEPTGIGLKKAPLMKTTSWKQGSAMSKDPIRHSQWRVNPMALWTVHSSILPRLRTRTHTSKRRTKRHHRQTQSRLSLTTFHLKKHLILLPPRQSPPTVGLNTIFQPSLFHCEKSLKHLETNLCFGTYNLCAPYRFRRATTTSRVPWMGRTRRELLGRWPTSSHKGRWIAWLHRNHYTIAAVNNTRPLSGLHRICTFLSGGNADSIHH